jgi:DNA-binding NarL/FixJ family response regulator
MPPAKQISVLVAEDHPIMRQGLCALLKADGNFRIIGEARTGREAVEMARTLAPEVIVMDIAMPTLNGLEATRQILAANPAAKILVLSAHSGYGYPEHLRAAGVAGFLEKQTSAESLATAIREIARGGTFFSSSILGDRRDGRRGGPAANDAVLRTRESEVLQLVAEGWANKQIAAELLISIKTVEKHRQSLMDKLNVHDTAGLTRYAIARGVIESKGRLTRPPAG